MIGDKISFSCESELLDKIEIILRQTDYTKEVAREKILEKNGDVLKVIKEYMGINENEKSSIKKSLNQEIYKQLRNKLDDSIRDFNKKQEDKLKKEINMGLEPQRIQHGQSIDDK